MGEKICLVAALTRLYILDSQPANIPLFCSSSRAFLWFNVVLTFKKQTALTGLAQANYSGYSFCKDVAQHAIDYDMLDEMIQKLGHWMFNIF